jgi:predicted regulator of Ras-like GTPase activity (Roadblock/LC7/MglB family)
MPPLRMNLIQQHGRGIQLPLQKILTLLPLEIQPRIRFSEVGDRTIPVPLEKILAQLSVGVVKVSFGELRQAAPEVFLPGNDRDNVLVPLPLEEILPRISPALIARRRTRRQVEVPEDISSPFSGDGSGLILSAGTAASPAKASPEPAPTRSPIPAHPVRPLAPATPAPSIFNPIMPPGTLPLRATAPAPFNPAMRNSITSVPTPPPPAAPIPPAPAVRAAMQSPRGANGSSSPAVPAGASQMPPIVAPKTAPASEPEQEPLLVGLSALAEGWPESVRREIVHLNIVDAKVALPAHAVEQALKQGRIVFTWRIIRSWIRPVTLASVSAQDAAMVELPLKVIAPLFLARQRETSQARQKVEVDADIPNLFFGFPQPVTTQPGSKAPATLPSDTNYYVWDDAAEMLHAQDESALKRGPSPGTKFVGKYATPNEVVSRAAALDGVAGSLIALPDGLMVASRLPSDVNGDTLAAFLPQIFGKVSQCTKELRMGELNNLNFTVGNVPWKIFRVNAIFFASFGRTGEPMPTAQLAALAAELDRKPK